MTVPLEPSKTPPSLCPLILRLLWISTLRGHSSTLKSSFSSRRMTSTMSPLAISTDSGTVSFTCLKITMKFELTLQAFLDAIDGSYCTYSAFGETGDCTVEACLDPAYPDPNPGGYKGQLQCGGKSQLLLLFSLSSSPQDARNFLIAGNALLQNVRMLTLHSLQANKCHLHLLWWR